MGCCMRALLASVIFVAGLAIVVPARAHLEHGPPAVLHGDDAPPMAAATTDGAETLEQLQAIVSAIAARHLTAGVSLAVVEDGRTVWTAGLGYADVEARRPASADTVYRVGSLSKSVLAITMASLEADGLLDLDAPVRDIAGDVEFENDWESTRPILVTELLQHSAGFDEMRFNEMFATADQLEWSTARVLAINPRSRSARWRPGTRHAYSHPGYTLAGHIVEVVTGRSFEEAVRERVLDPLQMRVASFRPTAEVEAQLATAYTGEGFARMGHWLLHHRPGSHLYVSAREMGRMVELLAGRGVVDGRRVVPERVVERIEHGTLPYPHLVPSYGLGIYSGQLRGVLWFGHGGWMPGYVSALGYLPSVRAGFVVMTNEAWDVDAIWQIESELIAYLQRKVKPAAPVPRVDLEPAELEALAGTYVRRNHDIEFERAFRIGTPAVVDVAGRDLRIRCADGRSRRAVPVGGGRFRFSEQTHPSMMLTAAAHGTPVFYDRNGLANHQRVPAVLALGFRVLLVFTLGALGLGVLWPAIWLPSALRGGRQVALRAWPCAGAWCVFLFVDRLYETPIPELATLNARTAALFVLSWGIPICAVASVVATASALLQRRGEVGTRLAAALVTLGVALAALHFVWHGMIAVRTWMW